ncbi:divergent polysaccharide deacetylase family protein [Borrelia sp. BU AG58]|uniref:divergent polysaccharide deacetylase family protein n=1 Tax=Borrelia sp. BU AG58 TaxID=2887345 RepID=UPI001E5FF41A|nr:divergent polysaccharide deacetylase family protein [Borrelia sp. BU AG58]UER67912.1 divergent polysaccharide deacetylase family protein [Borrelia sp. BU AG58]
MGVKGVSALTKERRTKIAILFVAITFIIAAVLLFFSLMYVKKNEGIVNLDLRKKLEKIKKENFVRAKEKLKTQTLKPKFYLIIDDVGYDEAMLEKFIKINLKINFAIIPFLSKSMHAYNRLASKNKITMIHFPMQSRYKNPIEKFHININDNKHTVRTKIERTFKEYPNARIMNNHMGSLITSNEKIMETILIKLKEENRYFFDSFTTKESVSIKVGEKIGIRVEKRDIFLDNKDNERDVTDSLEKAKQIARTKGFVKVIGHIWSKNTLKILRKESESLNEEFEFKNLLNLYEKEEGNESAWHRELMR